MGGRKTIAGGEFCVFRQLPQRSHKQRLKNMNDNDQSAQKAGGAPVKKITMGLILGWVLGILIGVAGIVTLFSKPLAGTFLLLAAAILLPPISKLLKEKFNFALSGGLKFVLVVVLLVLVGVFSGVTSTDVAPVAEKETSQAPEEVIQISAVQLSEKYNANTVAADAKYKGKTLAISGVIDNIGKDILDTPYIVLKGRELSLFGVQCMFSRADESKLASLSKEQNITLQGKVSGEIIGNIVVRGCQIVK